MAPENTKKQNKGKNKDNLVGISKNKSRRLFTYKEEDINKAIEDIKNKTRGIREACRFYGVPKTTVHDRLSGKVANKKPKVGPDPVLGLKGEETLTKWVLDSAKCGFPINKRELIESVSKIIQESGIKNPFKNGVPGDTWYQAFLKRHPEISLREPEGINNARAAVTESRIKLWFKDLRDYINSIDALDIFDEPSRIFNGDETGFSLCPKTGKVLGPKGYNNLYIIKSNNEKTNITVLVVFSACGKICNPLVIFPYVRPPKALIDNAPKSWVIGRSDSGWMKSDIFYEYITNSFNNWLTENGIKRPVILFVDGHKSHMSLSLSQFCEANGIILYALPPNTTHMLQPADVSVFKPLKQEWKNTVRSWQACEENINQTVTKINFCKILNQTFTKIDLQPAIVNGFRKCGLFPLNEDAVDYSKCVKDTQRRIRTSNSKQKSVTSKDFDVATKVINLIKEDIIKHNIDPNIILKEIDIAKDIHIANRKTPRNSNISNQSTSILATEDINIDVLTADVRSDTNTNIINIDVLTADVRSDTNTNIIENSFENISFPEPGSYISLNNISVTPLNEITVLADVHNVETEMIAETLMVSTPNSQIVEQLNESALMDEIAVYSDLQEPVIEIPTNHSLKTGDPIIPISTNQTFTLDEAFAKHLKFPEPPAPKDKIRNGPKLPSAISTDAWREYYHKKDEDKENKIKEKTRKQQLRDEIKERKAKEKDIKKKTKKIAKKIKCKKTRIKCSKCSDDLISDVEDDLDKNIGCDKCARWFHLKCTLFKDTPYSEAAQSDYLCPFCTE